jgi:hypothetical protein
VVVPDQLGDLGVLTEPGSVVAKAWEQIDRLVLRAPTEPRPDRLALVTGAGPIGMLAPAGVMCLIGISSGQRRLPVDMSRVGASMVLGNSLVFGTVSAARRHYEQAVGALARADPAWLA